MRSTSLSLRLVWALFFCGLLVAAGAIGSSRSAAARDGFGVGQIDVARPGAVQLRQAPPRVGGGGFVRPPIYRSGPPARHVPIIGGGAVGVGISGSGAIGGNNNNGGNNGRGAVTSRAIPPFVVGEVITAFVPDTTPQAIGQVARRYDLTALETQNLPLIGRSLYRWRIGGGRSVANVAAALGRESIVASVQPNYLFTLQEETATSPSGARDDAAQYVLGELQIPQAQQIATGKNVVVAVIDSEIDAKHPDLAGAIVKSFEALTGDQNPHAHGTSIAGAIASHGKLLGIAPDVKLLAVHAFDDTPGKAKGTSFAIYKSLQWAADNDARVVNMSFAGPADPQMQRMLAAAYDKGMVLIAAAGNGGPKSAPLYPAANPDVIAVTATDDGDHLFKLANRGRYIAVAAPGVDILALAPGGAYQLSTGTSIAAAHVSGIAALLIEHKPSLTPADIRSILIATAKPLGPPVPDSDFGAGLVNAYRAVTWLDRKPAEAKDGGVQAKQ